MKETILITGATGTVGSETVKALTGDDVKVRAGVHSLIKGDRFRELPNVELVHLDFYSEDSLQAAFTGVSRVFMITPFTEDQVAIGKILIDHAQAAGVKQVVRLSASGADAEPGIQLGRWHREIEKQVEASGLPFTVLRPTSFMQNFSHYNATTIRNEDKIYMPLGQGKVAYIDVRDIAEVARLVLTQPIHDNQIHELTGPEAITVNDVAHALTQATNRLIVYVDVPEEVAANSMRQLPSPDWMVSAMLELYGISKAGYAGNVTDTVAKITGLQARSIYDFADDCVTAFQPQ
jgi:uncharacterized protein YbjT (DUF2867 family)